MIRQPGASAPPDPLVPPQHEEGSGGDRVLPPLEPGEHAAPDPGPPHFAPTPDMGGPLVVTPAGGTTVATDGMRAAIDGSARIAAELGHATTAIHRAELVPLVPPLGGVALAVRRGADAARHLESALREAVRRYSDAEHRAWAAFDAAMSVDGALIGEVAGIEARGAVFGAAALLVLAGPLAAAGGAALLPALRSALTNGAAGLGRFLVAHPQLLSNPRFAAVVRGIADGLDEAVGTAAGEPAVLAVLRGATGRTGVESSARLLMGLGPKAGLLEESPVDVQRVDRQPVAAPAAGAAERLARVPEDDQVRIEKYTAPGRDPRYVVYVAPTRTFDPHPEGEPFDLASNVGGVGGVDVGAIRATELAMRDAGISSDSEVQLVGFSQGGMVAARVAADGNWNAVGLQTFGAPSGNVALPDGIQGMAVRNREDFVPALAGPQTDHHLLQVQRTVYADPSQMPTDQPVPGHQRVAYAATAEAIDGARSAEVRTQSAALDGFTADYAELPGSTITAYSYHATRRDGTG